jgi:hypothetical protein
VNTGKWFSTTELHQDRLVYLLIQEAKRAEVQGVAEMERRFIYLHGQGTRHSTPEEHSEHMDSLENQLICALADVAPEGYCVGYSGTMDAIGCWKETDPIWQRA